MVVIQALTDDVSGVICGVKETFFLLSLSLCVAKRIQNDGNNNGQSTDHLIHARLDISQYIAFLFTCMATH